MKHRSRLAFLLVLGIMISWSAKGQLRDQGMSMGVGAGATFGMTDFTKDAAKFFARGFIRYPFVKALQGELGFGFGTVGSKEFKTQIVPVEFRLIFSPFAMKNFNPYLYAGAGGLHYSVKDKPTGTTATRFDGWTGVFPGGVGLQVKLSDGILLEASGGYNYTLTKNLNGILATKKDAYLSGVLGLTLVGDNPNADPDDDGLTNAEERQIGTNKKIADTDGDGLKDGEEVHTYKTNPLNADSDGDGLKDGDEVLNFKTDPNKEDTDGDGLKDGEEVTMYKTDPLKADTDGDGLSDGDEVLKYKTDPLKADTDGDGLKDGEEVRTYKTDPLKADTDGGSVQDGWEITRGSNPLDPSDDVPKKVELKVETGKAIVLDGVSFESGKAMITASSESILEQAYNTLVQNPEISVEIRGYTDNVGKRASNVKLSQTRAEAVRAWLIAKGIAPDRITARGFGPDNPVAPNTTAEEKAKNRRIEFFRTK